MLKFINYVIKVIFTTFLVRFKFLKSAILKNPI